MSWFWGSSKAASPEPHQPATAAVADVPNKYGRVEPASSLANSFVRDGSSSLPPTANTTRPTRLTLRLELRESLDSITQLLADINVGVGSSSTSSSPHHNLHQQQKQSSNKKHLIHNESYLASRYYEAAVLVGHIRLILSALNQESQLDIARNDDDELESAVLYRDAMRKSQKEALERKALASLMVSFPLVCFSPLFTWGGSSGAVQGEQEKRKEIQRTIANRLFKSIGYNPLIEESSSGEQTQPEQQQPNRELQTHIRRALLDRSDELEKLLLGAASEVDRLCRQHPLGISDLRRHLSCALLQSLITDLNRAAITLSTTTTSTTERGPAYAHLLSQMATIAKSIINGGLTDSTVEDDEDSFPIVNEEAINSQRQAVLSAVVAEAMAAIDDALVLSASVTPSSSPSLPIVQGQRVCVISNMPFVAMSDEDTSSLISNVDNNASSKTVANSGMEIAALRDELRALILAGTVHPFVAKYLLRVVV